MREITTVGLDLAKSVFQVHATDAEDATAVRRQVKRAQVLLSFSRLRPCLVAMEACAGAHFWGRELAKLGREALLIPPFCVEPFARRGRTDQVDAEAICEAIIRPSLRLVPVKTQTQQAVVIQHDSRDFLVRQPTQLANAVRVHLGGFGIVVPEGVHNMGRFVAAADLPAQARLLLDLLAGQFRETRMRIEGITARILAEAGAEEIARRLQTTPGIGPTTASVPSATLPDVSAFRPPPLGLAGPDAEAAFDRQQGGAGVRFEDRQPIHPATAPSRSHERDLDPQRL